MEVSYNYCHYNFTMANVTTICIVFLINTDMGFNLLIKKLYFLNFIEKKANQIFKILIK